MDRKSKKQMNQIEKTTALAFEQQPRDGTRAFAAFKTYLELGPERSLAAVAKQLGISKTTVAKWSRNNHWQDRLPAQGRAPSQGRVRSPNGPSDNPQLPQSTINHPPSTHSNSQLSTLNPQLFEWDQQPGETNKNFAAFTAYLALGPARSLGKTAQATGRTRDQLAHWSQRWRWRARVAAYQAHLAAVERKATEDLVAAKSRDWVAMHEGIKRQAWAEAEDLIALAQDFRARWRDSDRLPDFGALIRAIELAFKLKQFAAGMPSEIKEVNTTMKATIDMDWEIAIRKAYAHPEGRDGSPSRPSSTPAQQLENSQLSALSSQLPCQPVLDVETIPQGSAGVPPASACGVPAAAPPHPSTN